MSLFEFALREGASKQRLEEIDEALEPPALPTVGGRPAWWTSDEDAWESWS